MAASRTNGLRVAGGVFLAVALYNFLTGGAWVVWLILGFLSGGFSLLGGKREPPGEQ
jgi:hypothetical protein